MQLSLQMKSDQRLEMIWNIKEQAIYIWYIPISSIAWIDLIH